MKLIYFDTSILVAAAASVHSHHDLATPWFAALNSRQFEACLSCHVIAEFYSTMTNLKFDFAIDPGLLASTLEKQIKSNFKIIHIPDRVYFDAAFRTARFMGRGAKIYDILHFEAALAAKCDALVTLNFRDFSRVADGEKIKIIDATTVKP